MADLQLNSEQVSDVANALNTATNSTIVPELDTLMTQVNGLLMQGGGLWLQQTSPALLSQYQQFNTSLQQLVQEIPQFALNFTQISGQLMNADQTWSSQIKAAASQESPQALPRIPSTGPLSVS